MRRPKTRGELRRLLQAGYACEVAAHVAEMTAVLLRGWLDCDTFTTRPSRNAGWTLFEPTPIQRDLDSARSARTT
jgi:hypothetical protein